MPRLEKFIEQGSDGRETGRVAYSFDITRVPISKGVTWHVSPSFNAADQVLKNPKLKEIFRAAIEDGYTIVGASVQK